MTWVNISQIHYVAIQYKYMLCGYDKHKNNLSEFFRVHTWFLLASKSQLPPTATATGTAWP